MKKDYEKIMDIFEKYGLESIRVDLLFDDDVHYYFNFLHYEKLKFTNSIQRELSSKEEYLLKKHTIAKLFLHRTKIPNMTSEEIRNNSKLWNEYYPFYHLLFQPDSLPCIHLILHYSISKYLAEIEGEEEHLQEFEINLEDKVQSFEVIVASLDERDMLVDFKEEFDKDPQLAGILSKFLKKSANKK